jgi:outer membrane lipoprotein-sorting protein
MNFLVILFSMFSSLAGGAQLNGLEQARLGLSELGAVSVETKKKVTLELTGRETTQSGKLYLKGHQFYWEITEPNKEYVQFDGKTLKTLSYDQNGSNPQAIIWEDKEGSLVKQPLFAILDAKQKLESHFSIKQEGVEFVLTAKNENVSPSSLRVVVEDKVIKKIYYSEDGLSKVVIEIEAPKPVEASLVDGLKVEIPKDAKITRQ